MAASIAQIGFGMVLSYAPDTAGTPGTYTPLVDLIDVKPAGWKVGVSEATHHASPNTADESTPGLVTYAEMEFQVSWSKTAYPLFDTLQRVVSFFKVTFPDGSNDVFTGYITEKTPATPLKERMTCTLKIQPTSKSTFTAAS